MSSCIYFLACNEFVKIGISENIARRIASIQTGNPNPVRLIAAYRVDDPYAIEAALHAEWKLHRTIGEWFKMTLADVWRARYIVTKLGGVPMGQEQPEIEPATPTDDDIAPTKTAAPKEPYAFQSGWRIEQMDRGTRYILRRGSGYHRESLPGHKWNTSQ